MKKLLITAAVLFTVASSARATAESKADVQAACVLGWATLSIEQGAKTVEAARNAGWQHCRHIKVLPPKGIDREDWKEVEGDRSEHLNSVIFRIFESTRSLRR